MFALTNAAQVAGHVALLTAGLYGAGGLAAASYIGIILAAATAATASPQVRTLSKASTGWSLTRVPTKISLTSAPVSTA